MQWERIHRDLGGSGSPCTCIATQGEDMVVSSGEDGRVNVLNVAHRQPVRTIGMICKKYTSVLRVGFASTLL